MNFSRPSLKIIRLYGSWKEKKINIDGFWKGSFMKLEIHINKNSRSRLAIHQILGSGKLPYFHEAVHFLEDHLLKDVPGRKIMEVLENWRQTQKLQDQPKTSRKARIVKAILEQEPLELNFIDEKTMDDGLKMIHLKGWWKGDPFWAMFYLNQNPRSKGPPVLDLSATAKVSDKLEEYLNNLLKGERRTTKGILEKFRTKGI